MVPNVLFWMGVSISVLLTILYTIFVVIRGNNFDTGKFEIIAPFMFLLAAAVAKYLGY